MRSSPSTLNEEIQPRWLSPEYENDTVSGSAPRKAPSRARVPLGVSHTPTTRTSLCREIAWVMIPTGLVKLMSTACGEHWARVSQ